MSFNGNTLLVFLFFLLLLIRASEPSKLAELIDHLRHLDGSFHKANLTSGPGRCEAPPPGFALDKHTSCPDDGTLTRHKERKASCHHQTDGEIATDYPLPKTASCSYVVWGMQYQIPHCWDEGLADGLARLIADVSKDHDRDLHSVSIADFGSGPGFLCLYLTRMGWFGRCDSYDLNRGPEYPKPKSASVFGPNIIHLDLGSDQGGPHEGFPAYDWVFAINIGQALYGEDAPEHLLDNIARRARVGAVIAWGDEGSCVVAREPNCKKNATGWVEVEMNKRGFRFSNAKTGALRDTASFYWTKSRLMAFSSLGGSRPGLNCQPTALANAPRSNYGDGEHAQAKANADLSGFFFAVLCHADDDGYRVTARRAWLHRARKMGADYRFFVAQGGRKDLAREMERQKDLVMLDFEDSWGNLPLKTVGFHRWLAKNRRDGFKWAVKVDIDVWVNLDTVALMQDGLPSERSVIGQIMVGQPIQHNKGRYGEPDNVHGSIFPPYCSGPLNILTIDVSHFIGSSTLNLKPGTRNEDAMIGRIIEAYDINFQDIGSKLWIWFYEKDKIVCRPWDQLFAIHIDSKNLLANGMLDALSVLHDSTPHCCLKTIRDTCNSDCHNLADAVFDSTFD